jgi:hypothetical protein
VRYDVDPDGLNPQWVKDKPILINNGVDNGDFGYHPGVRDLNNVAPRVGFAWNVGGKNDLVIRGGTGLYYNFPVSNVTYRQQFYNNAIAAVFLPTGTNFLNDPLAGVSPEAYLSGAVAGAAAGDDDHLARLRRPVRVAELDRVPEAARSAHGLRRGLHGPRRAVHGAQPRREPLLRPVTGYNKDPTIFGRPNPAWGLDQWLTSDGKTESRMISSSFTRRFNNLFQASVTYTRTLSMKDNTTGIRLSGGQPVRSGRGLGAVDRIPEAHVPLERDRQLPWQFSLSGRTSTGRARTTTRRARRGPTANRHEPPEHRRPITIPPAVLDRWEGPAVIATGTTWPRNALRGLPLHKVDMRVSKSVKLTHDVSVELLAELFNVFNRKNYGAYNTTITSASFGQPVATSGNAYVPRQGQLGVRVAF